MSFPCVSLIMSSAAQPPAATKQRTEEELKAEEILIGTHGLPRLPLSIRRVAILKTIRCNTPPTRA